jgi:hypothetical protein
MKLRPTNDLVLPVAEAAAAMSARLSTLTLPHPTGDFLHIVFLFPSQQCPRTPFQMLGPPFSWQAS